MSTIIKSLIALIAVLTSWQVSSGQQEIATTTSKLDMGKIIPYEMEVTYNKTSHIIFPSAIRYVDLGSDYLIAGKADGAENVLRVKASVKDFGDETNFSVITDDGRFYNFNVFYSSYPEILNYDLLEMQKQTERKNENDVLFKDLGDSAPSLVELLMETIYKKDRQPIKYIGSKSYGIQFLLKGIYIHNGKYYFHTELRNKSNVPFNIDFITFKVIDKKVAKRTVAQELPLQPIRIYKPLGRIAGKQKDQNIFLLEQFTMADDKVLIIEIFEKNGGRQQLLQVENSDLIHAELIKDMKIKIK